MNVLDLDANATTPLLPAAWEAMAPVMSEAYGNPSSAHALGRAARRLLEDTRDRVAGLLGATSEEVIFTSGATEANNLALFGLVPLPLPGSGGSQESGASILAAPIEHPCVIGPLNALGKQGIHTSWLPVTGAGVVEQQAVLARLTAETRLVTLMLVNHETGAIQPVRHIAKTVPKTVLVHTDAAQAIGKLPVNFRELGVTALTASAHKFRGPKGVGLLILKSGTKLTPRMHGGHQQRGHRPGTEPVALAVGLAVALEYAVTRLAENVARVTAVREAFLQTLCAENVAFVLNTPPEAVPHVANVSFPGCRSELLLMSLDLAGVACSTGSACSSGSLLPSPVLRAMGVSEVVLESAMRFSFGTTLSEADAVEAARRVAKCVRSMTRGQLSELGGGNRGE